MDCILTCRNVTKTDFVRRKTQSERLFQSKAGLYDGFSCGPFEHMIIQALRWLLTDWLVG